MSPRNEAYPMMTLRLSRAGDEPILGKIHAGGR